MAAAPPSLCLGLDSSTQGLKAIVINDLLKVTHEFHVNYDTDLPEYKTKGGVHRAVDGSPQTVTSPPQLWLAAMDRLFADMQKANFPFASVVAVSGSGQQHGSVYWKKGAGELLKKLDQSKPLAVILKDAFSVNNSPIWMDSSTSAYCEELEKSLGGPQRVAEITGSRAYERFTRNQIAKIFRVWPDAYANTERISLVSSFVASVLIGAYAPIDRSDATGMNLLDIRTKRWSEEILKLTAPDLAARLGEVAPSHTVVGKIAAYFVQRYHFSSECVVVCFAGDNPNSVVGMRLGVGDISVSLGTSDTLFGVLQHPTPSATEGHIFCNPADPDGYMALVCYKNGSLTREDVRDRVAQGSWDTFNALLKKTKPGNDGNIGFYFKETEITPQGAVGMHRFDRGHHSVASFAPEVEARAVVEGQFLSMRYHASNIGIKQFSSILATGGASKNKLIVQVAADVFGVPVFTAETANSASLGAAYRALHGLRSQAAFVPMKTVLAAAAPFVKLADPNLAAHAVYTAMLPTYSELERQILKGSKIAPAAKPQSALDETLGARATQRAQAQARQWLDATYSVIAKTVMSMAEQGLFHCKLRFEDLVALDPQNQQQLSKLLAKQNLKTHFHQIDSEIELKIQWGPGLL